MAAEAEQKRMQSESDEAGGGPPPPPPPQSPSRNPNGPSGSGNGSGGGYKGKSCKGFLYYSSTKKAKSKNPTCFGIPRSLQQVPSYVVGDTELQASKEGRSLKDFRYACVGYSVFLDKDAESSDPHKKKAELPFCVGLEVLMDRRTTAAAPDKEHAHIHQKEHKHEDGHNLPQQRTYKPPSTTPADDYMGRFTRNAGLVASGVAKNVNKIGNYVKHTVDDILYPYRKRPK